MGLKPRENHSTPVPFPMTNFSHFVTPYLDSGTSRRHGTTFLLSSKKSRLADRADRRACPIADDERRRCLRKCNTNTALKGAALLLLLPPSRSLFLENSSQMKCFPRAAVDCLRVFGQRKGTCRFEYDKFVLVK